jgi:hypothetical protein
MKRPVNKNIVASVAAMCLLVVVPVTSHGWEDPYPYPPGYYDMPGYGNNFGNWYAYTQPRWYLRGRMNRYGDYQIDVKLRDISMYDMYLMWLLYNGY